jgi:hypothetical protein
MDIDDALLFSPHEAEPRGGSRSTELGGGIRGGLRSFR